MDRRISLVVFVLCVIWLLVLNPIRFNQTAHAGNLSMKVPVLWKPMQSPGPGLPIVLAREWTPFLGSGVVDVMDRTGYGSKEGPWTMDAAREAQREVAEMPSKFSGFSNAKTFDLKAGGRTAVCVEETLNQKNGSLIHRDYRSLICYIVGTQLQFSFGGSPLTEPAAEKMLASLE